MFMNKVMSCLKSFNTWMIKTHDFFLLFLIGFALADHIRLVLGYQVAPWVMLMGYSVIAVEVLEAILKRFAIRFK